MNPKGLPVYVPPTGDEPLDAIEQAIVRALVPIVARKILEWVAADGMDADTAKPGTSRRILIDRSELDALSEKRL